MDDLDDTITFNKDTKSYLAKKKKILIIEQVLYYGYDKASF